MKKKNSFILKLIILLGLLVGGFGVSGVVNAAEHSVFVEDEANILSPEDRQYIVDLNEEKFAKLKGFPQYAVITLESLNDEDIEGYASRKFEKLGVGNKDLDNGFLFVIAVKDRKYRLETGYGVEDVITDSMKDDIVGDDVTELLRDENYTMAVRKVTENVERIVLDKYGNYEDSVAEIQAEKERTEKMLKNIGIAVLSFTGLGFLVIALYLFRKSRLRKYLSNYVSPNQTVYIKPGYYNKSMKLLNLITNKTMGKTTVRSIKNDDQAVREKIAIALIEDALIKLRKSNDNNVLYEHVIYMEPRYFDDFLAKNIDFLLATLPITKNPLYSQRGFELLMMYTEDVNEQHREALNIAERNKKIAKEAASGYLASFNYRGKDDVDLELLVSLMVYHLLKGNDLSDPTILNGTLLSRESLKKAFGFAKKKSNQIEKGYRRQAINDLNDMMFDSYYLNTFIVMSSYSSSSSSSGGGGGGGSSFGGGSSGGGGFSGSW